MTKKTGSLIGAIDEGTSSTRFVVYSVENGEAVAFHQTPITSSYPHEGWVEQRPTEILKAVLETMEEVALQMRKKDLFPSSLSAIGITNQRETTVLWDKTTGIPLYNAIVWMDNRTNETIDNLLSKKTNKNKDQLKPLCGLPISPYFSALKYRWLIDNVPEVQKAIEEDRCLFGTIDTWLIWNLTGGVNDGVHKTDVTNASRTMFMNLETLKWDPSLSDFFNIPVKTFPEICSSSEIYGYIADTAFKGVPISGVVGDQHASLIGHHCCEIGSAKSTYGTGCFLLCNTGTQKVFSTNGLLTTVAYQLGPDAMPVYALEGSNAVAGAVFTWLRDNVDMLESYGALEQMAESVPDTNDCYFVPAFQGLYAPHWDPRARGLICGLTLETNKGHIIRAALEAICYQTRDLLEAISQDLGKPLVDLKVDGGMTKNNLFLQLLSNICGSNVVNPSVSELTAMGAAIAAGMAKGIDTVVLDQIKSLHTTIKPQISIEGKTYQYEPPARCLSILYRNLFNYWAGYKLGNFSSVSWYGNYYIAYKTDTLYRYKEQFKLILCKFTVTYFAVFHY